MDKGKHHAGRGGLAAFQRDGEQWVASPDTDTLPAY